MDSMNNKTGGRFEMKKIVVMVLVMAMGILMANPSIGYTHSSDYDRGYNRPVVVNNYNNYGRRPVGYERSHDNSGLLIAGAALGVVAIGAIVAGSMSQPRQVVRERVVYTAPPAYAQAPGYEAPPGQWVTVQGQWLNGQWIPPHNVWVPVNP
jgi:hypothetical protein